MQGIPPVVNHHSSVENQFTAPVFGPIAGHLVLAGEGHLKAANESRRQVVECRSNKPALQAI
jgi:hypothetical protein